MSDCENTHNNALKSASSESPEWFKDSFGALYPMVYKHRSRDAGAAEIERLASWLPLSPSDRILDICCGEGRHLETLIGLGFDAVGLDLSQPLLRNGMSQPMIRDRLFCADIRHLPVRPGFTVALNLFSSFGYFTDEKENLQAMSEMLSSLVPHGTLVVDHMNRDRLARTLVPESDDRYDGYRLIQQRRIENNRVIKKIIWIPDTGAQREFIENVRIYTPEEMTDLVTTAGGTDIRMFGGFDGRPFDADSTRMITVCRNGRSQ